MKRHSLTTLVTSFAAAAAVACGGNTDSGQSPIVGGQDTAIVDLPWQVSLQDSLGHLCGGSILNEEYVLTANHCIIGPGLSVLAGVTKLSEADQGQLVPVAEIFRFPGFFDPLSGGDAAVLKLAARLDLSGPNASAIELVTAADAAAGLTDPGVMTTVSGWGAQNANAFELPDHLQSVEVPIISNEDAQAAYADVTITEDQLAAGFMGVGGKDACQGDSGGPLVVPSADGTGVKLAGIVSWGFGCADPEFPGMYSRVSSFEQFVADAMAGTIVPPPATCEGACGGVGPNGFCFCDSVCSDNGDCCPDFEELCPDVGTGGSCENNCGGSAGECFCDEQCTELGDCCSDFAQFCEDEPEPEPTCCRVCSAGKACGDSCIPKAYTCTKEPGCACNADN